jgi:hypothetical protein
MSEPAYNVEDGTPPPDPAPAPEPQAQEPAPGPVAAEPEHVEVAGQKMVPLAALQAEREAARALKQKADQVDQVLGWYNQHQPYVDFLKNNPDLLKPRQAAPTPEPAPAPSEADPQLVQLARTLDLYTPEGQPDAKRAAALANFVDQRSGVAAEQRVKPLAEQTLRERANTNYQHALNATTPDGRKPNPQILQQLWTNGDPKVLATPEGAAMAVLMAVGMDTFAQQPQPQAPAQPPVVSEPAGGRNVSRASISEFEQRIMNVRGINPTKYAEMTANFKPGHANVLED